MKRLVWIDPLSHPTYVEDEWLPKRETYEFTDEMRIHICPITNRTVSLYKLEWAPQWKKHGKNTWMEKEETTPKKYEFTGETIPNEHISVCGANKKLHRIRRISDGLIGGWIESESNLSHKGDCFVYDNAQVFGGAKVWDNAQICNNAKVLERSSIYDNAKIYDDVRVFGNSKVYQNAIISASARINGSEVFGDAHVVKDVSQRVIHGDGSAREKDVMKETVEQSPKKYVFTGEKKQACLPGDYHFLTGLKPGKSYIYLHRIKRISDGLIGGWIEKEENLSHEGECFVYDEAIVCGDARLSGNAFIYGHKGLTSAIECDDYIKKYFCDKMSDEAKINEIKVVKTETYTITKDGQTMSLTRDEIEKALKGL